LFLPREGFALNGILSFLTGQCGGNLKEKRAMKVSANGTLWANSPLKVFADLKSSWKAFATPNVANSWIQIDSLNYRINPTHDSIRTRTEYDHDHPRS
jgi:hypothetical protein